MLPSAAAPPSSVMNSRRLMGRPFPWNTPYHTLSAVQQTRSVDDRAGSDSVIRRCLINARITPASGPQRLIGMSCECQYATSGASDGGLSVVVHLGQRDAAFAR